ncbi:MAG: hypothetical protein JWR84_3511 [Caulobacter sp.]|nr:hypothetical protein [Caulobacter sp.]
MRVLIPLLALASLFTVGAGQLVLTPDGLGALKIGMTVEEARAAAPGPLVATESSDDLAICGDYLIEGQPMAFLTEDGRVARITLYETGTTAEGVALGDPAEKVHQVYGKAVEREPAPYGEPPAHDLYVWRTPERGYRFAIDDKGRVVTILAGNRTIRYMEGCA